MSIHEKNMNKIELLEAAEFLNDNGYCVIRWEIIAVILKLLSPYIKTNDDMELLNLLSEQLNKVIKNDTTKKK